MKLGIALSEHGTMYSTELHLLPCSTLNSIMILSTNCLSGQLTLQWGQTNPLMFSTTPKTGIFVFLQKESSLLTSDTETPWRSRMTIFWMIRVFKVSLSRLKQIRKNEFYNLDTTVHKKLTLKLTAIHVSFKVKNWKFNWTIWRPQKTQQLCLLFFCHFTCYFTKDMASVKFEKSINQARFFEKWLYNEAAQLCSWSNGLFFVI